MAGLTRVQDGHMSLQAEIDCFSSLLEERLAYSGVHSEEDLRFTFLHSFVSRGFAAHWELRCEAPLPGYPAHHLDALIVGSTTPRIAAEFKFHRDSFSPVPRSTSAGALFSDLFRLGIAHAKWKCECLLVYLADHSMMQYLCDGRGACTQIFSLPVGQSVALGLSAIAEQPDTFRQALNGFCNPVAITPVLRRAMTNSLQLHVYMVEHQPSPLYEWD
jgi:hypothetical protein